MTLLKKFFYILYHILSSFRDPSIFGRFHRTINKTLYNLKIITRLKKLTLLKKIFIYYEYKIECSPMF